MARVPVASPINAPRVPDAPFVQPAPSLTQIGPSIATKLSSISDTLQDAEDTAQAAEALGKIQKEVTDLEFQIKSTDGTNAGEIYDAKTQEILQRHSQGLTQGAISKLSKRFNTFNQSTRLRVRNFARQQGIQRGKAGIVNVFETQKQGLIDLYASSNGDDNKIADLQLNNARVLLEQSKNIGFFKPEDADKFYRTYRDEVKRSAILKASRQAGYKTMMLKYGRGDFSGAPHLKRLYDSFTPEDQQDLRDMINKEAWRVHKQDQAIIEEQRKTQERALDEENDAFMRRATEFPSAAAARIWLAQSRNNRNIEAKSIKWVEDYIQTYNNQTDQDVFRQAVEDVVDGTITQITQMPTQGLDRTDFMTIVRLIDDKKNRKTFFQTQIYKQAMERLDNDARLLPKLELWRFANQENKNDAVRRTRIIHRRLQDAVFNAITSGTIPQDQFAPKPTEFDILNEIERQFLRTEQEEAAFEKLKKEKTDILVGTDTKKSLDDLKAMLKSERLRKQNNMTKTAVETDIFLHEQKLKRIRRDMERFIRMGYAE